MAGLIATIVILMIMILGGKWIALTIAILTKDKGMMRSLGNPCETNWLDGCILDSFEAPPTPKQQLKIHIHDEWVRARNWKKDEPQANP